MEGCTEKYLSDIFSITQLTDILVSYSNCNPRTIKDINILGYMTFYHKNLAQKFFNDANEHLKKQDYTKYSVYKGAYDKEISLHNQCLQVFTQNFLQLNPDIKINRVITYFMKIRTDKTNSPIISVSHELIHYIFNKLLTPDEAESANKIIANYMRISLAGGRRNRKYSRKNRSSRRH